jgi:Matrixin
MFMQKNKKYSFLSFLIVLIFSGCSKPPSKAKYAACDNDLYNFCTGKDIGDYCTFGFKWGSNNPFANPGLEKPGPGAGNVDLTYKFMEEGFVFSTHSKENVSSLSFDNNILSCAKAKFKDAFIEWSSVTKVNFREASANENADIKIVVADIEQSSIGYPNYSQSPCINIKGLIVFRKNYYNSCQSIYGVILHEIGHTLGLGHVNSKNVMHPSESYLYSTLQSGDIRGIRSIYGMR